LIYHLLFAITLSSVSLLPQKSSQEFKSLFDEYESQETIESQIVKELDRFDVMLQAFQYEKSEFEAKGRQIKFQEFFDNAIGKIKSKQLIDLSEALHRQRTQFWLNIESDKQSNKQ
jgi:putative hydrolase of HD superfamily